MGEWDYWQIDGRGGEFPVLPGSEDAPRLIRGELDLRGRPRVFPPGTCEGGPRGLLDFDAARRPVAAEAARDFNADVDELPADAIAVRVLYHG
ncbi:hypothetical protein [Streptomyces olivochromogenes]|uniref:hypothetical protein n=1 Tax=Streptomyces olivochromogenes TaxID=1963 RepID=UPI0036A8486F